MSSQGGRLCAQLIEVHSFPSSKMSSFLLSFPNSFSNFCTGQCVENCHFGKSFFFFSFLNWAFSFWRLFHSPQVLLEFCGFMQLSAVSFFSEFFLCPLVSCISVGYWELVYTYLFLREVIVWSVFPVCNLCSAEDLPKIIMFIVPDHRLQKNPPSPFSLPHRPAGCENW